MSGWTISVIRLAPEEVDQIQGREAMQAAMLAYWETGVMGVRWLQPLLAEGKVQQIRSGGYPDRYVAQAGDVLPFLSNPASLPEVRGQVALYDEHIAACPATVTITINVWDQS